MSGQNIQSTSSIGNAIDAAMPLLLPLLLCLLVSLFSSNVSISLNMLQGRAIPNATVYGGLDGQGRYRSVVAAAAWLRQNGITRFSCAGGLGAEPGADRHPDREQLIKSNLQDQDLCTIMAAFLYPDVRGNDTADTMVSSDMSPPAAGWRVTARWPGVIISTRDCSLERRQ